MGMTVKDAGMTGGATLPLWIADQVRNDGAMLLCLVITLTFDSSPIKGEGVLLVGLSCFVRVTRRPVDTALKPV